MRPSNKPGEVLILDQVQEIDVIDAHLAALARENPIDYSQPLPDITPEYIDDLANSFGYRYSKATEREAPLNPSVNWQHAGGPTFLPMVRKPSAEFAVRVEDTHIIVSAAKRVLQERNPIKRGYNRFMARTDTAQQLIKELDT